MGKMLFAWYNNIKMIICAKTLRGLKESSAKDSTSSTSEHSKQVDDLFLLNSRLLPRSKVDSAAPASYKLY
jgi:hypothetical protein